MNKFKKILGVALIAIMIMMPVFGAVNDTSTLTINTEVLGVLQIGVYDTEITSNANFIVFDFATGEIGDMSELSDFPVSSQQLYLTVRTNQRVSHTITIDAPNLIEKIGGVNSLGYTLEFTPDTSSGSITKSVASNTNDETLTVTASNGLRIVRFPFKAMITESQFQAASVGEYETNVTFVIATT